MKLAEFSDANTKKFASIYPSLSYVIGMQLELTYNLSFKMILLILSQLTDYKT